MSAREPLYKRGQDQIREYILEHGLEPGDALPTEAELATIFGMSRLSLREAIKGLQTIGLLVARPGASILVAEFSFAPILDNLPYSLRSRRSFRDLLELRESLEEGLCGNLLSVIRPRDCDQLAAIATAMKVDSLTPAAIAELDRRFHALMYAPLENKLVSELIDVFWHAFNKMQKPLDLAVPSGDRLFEIHMAIVDALRSRDEMRTISAVRDHFADIRNWVIVYGESE